MRYLVICLIIVACQTKQTTITPTHNDGGYELSFLKSQKPVLGDSITIYGRFKDVETKEAIKIGAVQFYCMQYFADSLGNYTFTIKRPSTEIFLTGSAVGYRLIETDQFTVGENELVNINLFLSQDDRPLINCEGIPSNRTIKQ